MSHAATDLLTVDRAFRHGRPLSLILQIMSDRATFHLCGEFSEQIFDASSKAHFNAIATNYVGNVTASPHMVDALRWQLETVGPFVQQAIANQGSLENIEITDFGAGAGAISSWPVLSHVQRRSPVRRRIVLTCYDTSSEMISETFKITPELVPPKLSVMFGEQLPAILDDVRRSIYRESAFPQEFESRHYGQQHVVICSFLLHHLNLQSKRDAINKIYSILRDDGFLVFVDEYRTYEDNLRYIRSLMPNDIPYGLECFLDDVKYSQIFSQAGFYTARRTLLHDGRTLAFILTKKNRTLE